VTVPNERRCEDHTANPEILLDRLRIGAKRNRRGLEKVAAVLLFEVIERPIV
jgi:hypothetical protein